MPSPGRLCPFALALTLTLGTAHAAEVQRASSPSGIARLAKITPSARQVSPSNIARPPINTLASAM